MAKSTWRRVSWSILAVTAIGCNSGVSEPAGTGTKEAAQSFYDALLHKNWSAAYPLLDSDSRQQCSAEQFKLRSQQYCKSIGFEPTEVRVRSCEEQGDKAIAHIMWNGRDAAKQRSFRDAVTLRRIGSDWKIVLSPRFGESR